MCHFPSSLIFKSKKTVIVVVTWKISEYYIYLFPWNFWLICRHKKPNQMFNDRVWLHCDSENLVQNIFHNISHLGTKVSKSQLMLTFLLLCMLILRYKIHSLGRRSSGQSITSQNKGPEKLKQILMQSNLPLLVKVAMKNIRWCKDKYSIFSILFNLNPRRLSVWL